jgi:hypothetical protein
MTTLCDAMLPSPRRALLTRRCAPGPLPQTGISLAALAAAGLCAVVVVSSRPRVDYSPLLRDLPGGGGGGAGAGFGAGHSLLGRAGYGAVGTSGGAGAKAAAGGDVEIATFSQKSSTAWGIEPEPEKAA